MSQERYSDSRCEDAVSIQDVNDLIGSINGNNWESPQDWTPVPAAFSTGGRGRKYWKSYSEEQGILYLYGPLDFTVFFLPDTVVHQTLDSPPALRHCVAFMEIPPEKLKMPERYPSDHYLRRFQGIYANVFNIAILPCEGVGGKIENLSRMKILSDRFSPLQFQMAQKHHDVLNQLSEEVKRVVTDIVGEEMRKGAVFAKERDVAGILDPVVQSFFREKGYKTAPTQFKGLWRNPNCDHAFAKDGNQWPERLFVELKCDVDIKAPLVQVSEDLAADAFAAVLQIRVPSKPTREHELASVAKRRMESCLPVRYIEVKGW
jgi:hypothetical protein